MIPKSPDIGGHLPIPLLNSNDSDSKRIDAVSCHQQKIKQSASLGAQYILIYLYYTHARTH